MTIGADYLSRLPKFTEALKDSGTIHVAVVSGFNINLVFNFLISLLGSKYSIKNYLIAIAITFMYALLSGFEPPVVRSWIMGCTLALGRVYGRVINPLFVLVFSAIVMIIYNPAYLFSLSFQLSFLATLGLIIYSGIFAKVFESSVGVILNKSLLKTAFFEDLTASLSAQMLVWPLISYRFGTVSIISPLANAFILWTIPISTILGFLLLISCLFFPLLSILLSHLVFLFVDIFEQGVKFFASLPYASVSFSLNNYQFFSYYIVLGIASLIIYKQSLSARSVLTSNSNET